MRQEGKVREKRRGNIEKQLEKGGDKGHDLIGKGAGSRKGMEREFGFSKREGRCFVDLIGEK